MASFDLVGITLFVIIIGYFMFMIKNTNKGYLRTLYYACSFFFMLLALNFTRLQYLESGYDSLTSLLNLLYIILMWITIFVIGIYFVLTLIESINQFKERKFEREFDPFM